MPTCDIASATLPFSRRRERITIGNLPGLAQVVRFRSSQWVPRRSRAWSPEPCAQVRILLGAQVKIYFSNIYSSAHVPAGSLHEDSMNTPSTRHFMTRCHDTRPPDRLHANLLARDLRERIPSQRGELPCGPASRPA